MFRKKAVQPKKGTWLKVASLHIYIACNAILDVSRNGLGGPGILNPLELGQLAPQIRQIPMSKEKTICN